MTSATIFADASLCHETKLAGWASWIVGGGQGSHLHSGVLKTTVADIGEAEFLALGNALQIAIAIGVAQPGAEVLLQSDSMWALCALRTTLPACADRPFVKVGLPVGRHKRAQYSATILGAMDRIRAMVASAELKVATRHVRGHTRGDGRQWVNRACDKAAKKAMRAARAAARIGSEAVIARAADTEVRAAAVQLEEQRF